MIDTGRVIVYLTDAFNSCASAWSTSDKAILACACDRYRLVIWWADSICFAAGVVLVAGFYIVAAPQYGEVGRRPTWKYFRPTENCSSPTRNIWKDFFIDLIFIDDIEVYIVLYWRRSILMPHWCALMIPHINEPNRDRSLQFGFGMQQVKRKTIQSFFLPSGQSKKLRHLHQESDSNSPLISLAALSSEPSPLSPPTHQDRSLLSQSFEQPTLSSSSNQDRSLLSQSFEPIDASSSFDQLLGERWT